MPRPRVSLTSGPASASRTSAASAAQRVSGPGESWLGTRGTIPDRLTRPTVGLKPNTDVWHAGAWMEFCVSEPIATMQKPAATAAADPTLEPCPLA